MAIATEQALLSAEQFMDLKGEGRHELVRGKVIDLSPTHYIHGCSLANIITILQIYGKSSGHGYALAGELAVQTERDPDTVRGADIAFYSHGRLPKSFDNPKLPVIVPDLVVEIHSPSNRPGETLQKVYEYLNAGVLAVWVVYPEKRCLVIYRPDDAPPTLLRETDIVENQPELPGFQCRVAEFFE